MIKQEIIDHLDKNKVYCNHCINENIITELVWNENIKKFNSCKNHNKNANSFILKFYDNNWCIFRGKGEISKFINYIEADKDIQNKYLNCKFVYIDINKIDNSIRIEKSENGNFFVSKFLNKIEYIHRNYKDLFINYKVNLIGICKECNEIFNFKELSILLTEPGDHFCCNNHSLIYRNKSDKMRKIVSDKMFKWHQTKEGKEFTRNHYIKLGNSDAAKENLKKVEKLL